MRINQRTVKKTHSALGSTSLLPINGLVFSMDFRVLCTCGSSFFSEVISEEIREGAKKPVADGTSEVLLIVRVVLGRVVAAAIYILKGQRPSLSMNEAMDANYYSTVIFRVTVCMSS